MKRKFYYDFYNRKRYVEAPTEENTSDADGVDAIKDAAAEMGIDWRDPEAEIEARERGWLKD